MQKSLIFLGAAVGMVGSAVGCSGPGPTSATNGGGGSAAADACQPGQQLCGTSCVYVESNPAHCGTCFNACPPGTSCAASACACQAGLTSCNGQCVDTLSDPVNCGACGSPCSAGLLCSLGTCSATCATGLTQCGTSCVDVTGNAFHCGMCDNACPAGSNCLGGSCHCAVGMACGGVCVDTASDSANCGACANVCTNGSSCVSGVCTEVGVGGTGGAGGTATGGAGASVTGGTAGTGGGNVGGSGNTGGGSDDPVGFINEQGRVVASGNDFGIVGDWYAFSDGVTSDQTGNPYRDGAYCITGEALGDENYTDHWGAGLGLDLNNPDRNDKLPYEFEGRINGFRMTLAGTVPTPAQVHFVNDLENDVTPFITVDQLGESVVYYIAEAQVPLSWNVPNSGARVDNGILYSIQVQTPGADPGGAGPIDLCITEFEPLYDPNYDPVVDDGPYINSDGFILAENNDFGMQGPVYAISDGNSSGQSGNPYSNGSYCISGTFTGAEDDWGAGIAFDLNKAPGGGDRLAFPNDGTVAGFRIGLSGDTPGDVRVQFIINEPQDGAQPFLVGQLNTTTTYPVAWAQVPTSWDVTNSGEEVGSSIYTLQVYLDGTEPGPFEVCVDDFMPLTATELAAEAQPAAAGYNGARTVDASVLSREYDRWKARHFEDCGDGTACIPRDDAEGATDCISEGVAYGMLITVGNDDRDAFDKLWAYYQRNKNANGVMNWQTNVCGSATSTGSATDGELDAGMALIQASCRWGGTYESDARTLLSAIINSEVTNCNGRTVLKPGDTFGGCDRTNPSYVAPGYYRVFQQLTGDATWGNLLTDGYALLQGLQSGMGGLVPNWTDGNGTIPAGDDGEYGPDASRTPWRVATDYVWHGDQSAITFLDSVSTYADGHGGIQRLFAPASNYRGALAMSGWHQDSAKAQEYTNAWLLTSVDDTSYYPGTLRLIYLMLAAHQFPNGC